MRDTSYYMALNYRKVLRMDEDGVFIVEVPDLPGCVADGDSITEAFANLEGAMEVWFASRLESGETIQEPREAADCSGKFVVRLPKRLHHALAEQAEEEACSLNQYVVGLLSEAVGGYTQRTAVKELERCTHLLNESIQKFDRLHDYGAMVRGDFTQLTGLSTQNKGGSQIGAASSSIPGLSLWMVLDSNEKQKQSMAYRA